MADVVERTHAGVPWDIALPEFLDTFYFALRGWPGPSPQSCLEIEPPQIDDRIWNAQLGAIGEHLALRWHLSTPPWTRHPSRFLSEPYFPSGTENYKGWYFVQSPTAFRRRMIFTEAEPLRRARMPHPAFHSRDAARGYRWHDGAVRAIMGCDAETPTPTLAICQTTQSAHQEAAREDFR